MGNASSRSFNCQQFILATGWQCVYRFSPQGPPESTKKNFLIAALTKLNYLMTIKYKLSVVMCTTTNRHIYIYEAKFKG